MVEATDLRELDDLPVHRRLDRSGIWRVLVERQVGARAMVVANVSLQDPSQMILVENDHVVETFSPSGADDPFDVRVLPWRARCCPYLLDAKSTDASGEIVSIDAISVSNYVARGGVPRE
jgi:hypothetical protein